MDITLAIGLGIIAVLILLIVAPSRAGMWRAVKHFASDHEEANMLIDARKAARKADKAVSA